MSNLGNRRNTVTHAKNTVKRPPVRTTDGRCVQAGKLGADAVIAAAQRQLDQLDIDSIPDQRQRVIVATATAFAASIRTRRVSKQAGRSTGPKRTDKQGRVWTSRGYVQVSVTDAREVKRQISSFVDLLLRSLPETQRERFEIAFLHLNLKPASAVDPVTRALVCLSDILRATLEPWHHDVLRRFGIVCLPDGYPVTVPSLRSGEMLGRIVDELEYLVVRQQIYTVRDHGGDPHDIVGAECQADGTVEDLTFRAFRGVSISSLNKLREKLLPPEKRKLGSVYGPAWPWPTRLPGFRSGKIHMAEYLAALRFGAIPDSEGDLLDDECHDVPDRALDETDDYPSLPAGRRRMR